MSQRLSQFDGSARVVALSNLRALCERASGICHRYWIEEPKRLRVGAYVRVWYSNPNQYGAERPFCREYPIVSILQGVVRLDATPMIGIGSILAGRTRKEPKDLYGEGWQCFNPIEYGPELFRSGPDGKWETRAEIESRRAVDA